MGPLSRKLTLILATLLTGGDGYGLEIPDTADTGWKAMTERLKKDSEVREKILKDEKEKGLRRDPGAENIKNSTDGTKKVSPNSGFEGKGTDGGPGDLPSDVTGGDRAPAPPPLPAAGGQGAGASLPGRTAPRSPEEEWEQIINPRGGEPPIPLQTEGAEPTVTPPPSPKNEAAAPIREAYESKTAEPAPKGKPPRPGDEVPPKPPTVSPTNIGTRDGATSGGGGKSGMGFTAPTIDQRGLPLFGPPPTPGDFSAAAGVPPSDITFSSLRSPRARPKKRIIYDLYGGAGANSTRVFSTSVGLRLDDWILGAAVDRGQWLDAKTNTGKFTEGLYADLCAAVTLETSWLSLQPCYRYGVGRGTYKQRNALNEIEENTKDRAVFKFYGRFVMALDLPTGGKLMLEGVTGYSQDVFLYGAYNQVWVKTPILGLSLGVEDHAGQRQALLVGFAFGAVNVLGN